ncbi:MAG: NUDIX hydrolase [Ktedonobacterales bacterium]
MSSPFPAVFLPERQHELADLAQSYGQPLIEIADASAYEGYLRSFRMNKRVGEACMVIRRPNGRLLTMTKPFYPAGVYRLPTGGIERGEAILHGLLRETEEETSLTVEVRRFLALAVYTRSDTDIPLEWREYATYAFLLDEVGGTLHVQDEHEQIADYREITPDDLAAIVMQLDTLGNDYNDELDASIGDWGHYRAVIHRLVWQALQTEG